MKRIIKHGTRKKIKYYFICDSCGCEFEMTNMELIQEQQTIIYTVLTPCPECGNITRGEEVDE